MRPEDPGPLKDKKLRATLRTDDLALVNDGSRSSRRRSKWIRSTTTPWTYANLLHRERADLAETPEE